MPDNQPSPSLSHYVEYAALRFLRGLLCLMPVDWASSLMGKIWRVIGPFNERHGRVLRHLSWAFGEDKSETDRQAITRDMWENLGRTFAEGLLLDRILADTSRFDATCATFQDDWRAQKDGTIIATHHFGNWELASSMTVIHSDDNLLGIYKRIKNPLVEAFFLKLRQPAYPGGLYSEQKHGALKAVQHVRTNNTMAMVADLRDNRGIAVNFFDMPMFVNTFPAALAHRYGKPLYAAQMRRVKGSRFVLDMVRIDVDHTGDKKADIAATTQRLHSQFQTWIEDNPDQFMWAPFRWSGRKSDHEKPISWTRFIAQSQDQSKNRSQNEKT